MAVDTSAVQITINVVDGNSGEVVSKVTQSLGQLGAAGATTGQRVKQGMDAAGAASLSSVEKTRLLTEEFGVRLPRAMVKLVSQSKIAQAALSAVGTGLVALGAIQIGAMVFTQLIDGAKRLWDSYFSLTVAAEKYNQEAMKARSEDFVNTRSIGDTRVRIQSLTEDIRALDLAEQNASARGFWTNSIGNLLDAHKFAELGVNARKQLDALQKERLPEQEHQHNLASIDLEHAGDARLRGEAKITAEKQKQLEIDREDARFDSQRAGIYGNPVAKNSLWTTGQLSDSQMKEMSAAQQADAESFNLQREHAQELAHLRAEAVQAGLHGIALNRAQEAATIDELKFKDMDSAAARDAIHLKYHNEEMKRLQDENREISKMREQTQLAGLTGVARIEQEGRNKINDIYNDPDQKMNPGQRLAAVNEITKQTHAEVLTAEEEFTRRVNELADESATHQISGFARIRADAQKQIDAIRQDYEKLYGKNTSAPEYRAHLGELNRATGIIQGTANEQTSELSRKNAEETEQIEAQARAKLMSAEKNQTAAIETEYEERLRKYQEELNQQEISQTDYNRRAVAAEQLKDAQLVESAKAAREKMATEFSSFFKSPTEALKIMGDKAAGAAAAALVQRVQNHYGGAGATANDPLNGGGKLGGLFDHLAGRPKGVGNPAARPDLTSAVSSVKAISLSTAEIHVQSANIGFGGATAGASGAGFGPGGGTFSGSALGASGGFGSSGGTIGGTGNAGYASSGPVGMTGTPGAIPAPGNPIGTAMGDVNQGIGLGKQAMSIWGGGSGQATPAGANSQYAETQGDPLSGILNADGSFSSSGSTNGGMLGGGGFGANAMGAAGGALGLYSAYEGNGGVGGALSGAMSGMQLGMALGGPVGAGIGAAAGAIVGAFGFGGREKARVYDLKQVRPRIANDTQGYQTGSMDYLAAYSDMQSLDMEAKKTTNAFGRGGQAYYQDTIKKELREAEQKFSAEQRAGRSQFTATAAQYDWGGPIDNFGALGTTSGHGLIHAQQGEFMIEQQAANTHAGALNAINSGATYADMARYYGAESTTMPAQTQSSWGGDIHVHALDAKSGVQWLMANKHVIRSAMNASFGENSGGADA